MLFTILHLAMLLFSCAVLYLARRQQRRTEAWRKLWAEEIDERIQEIMIRGYVQGIHVERARRGPVATKQLDN